VGSLLLSFLIFTLWLYTLTFTLYIFAITGETLPQLPKNHNKKNHLSSLVFGLLSLVGLQNRGHVNDPAAEEKALREARFGKRF